MQLPLWLAYLAVILVAPWIGSFFFRVAGSSLRPSVWRWVILLGFTGSALWMDVQQMGWQGFWQAEITGDNAGTAAMVLIMAPLIDLLLVAIPHNPFHREN